MSERLVDKEDSMLKKALMLLTLVLTVLPDRMRYCSDGPYRRRPTTKAIFCTDRRESGLVRLQEFKFWRCAYKGNIH